MKKKIQIITTGGTIAMTSDDTTGAVNLHQPDSLQQYLPNLTDEVEVSMDPFFHVPSPHLQLHDLYQLGKKVKQMIEKQDIDGIVITHGTDLIEETAYYLHRVLKPDKPVIITGAMRSQNTPGYDGLFNLTNAVRVAAQNESARRGILVVIQEEIHSAQWVTKKDTTQLRAFASPHGSLVGRIHLEQIEWFAPPAKPLPSLPLLPPQKKVELLTAVIDMNPAPIQWLVTEKQIDGLVIEALGQGNIPLTILSVIEQAISILPVIIVSRCYQGDVLGTYHYKGGGGHLEQLGAIFAPGLNGPKARIALALALETTSDRVQPQKLLDQKTIS